jgi:hypothetical protein
MCPVREARRDDGAAHVGAYLGPAERANVAQRKACGSPEHGDVGLPRGTEGARQALEVVRSELARREHLRSRAGGPREIARRSHYSWEFTT